MKFYNEENQLVDYKNLETVEQFLVKKYIGGNDSVLELGARYGTVSCTINKKIYNPVNQVSVEPDGRVISALKKNRDINNCKFHIIYGFISNEKLSLERTEYVCQGNEKLKGYGSTFVKDNSSNIKSYNLTEIEKNYNLQFDSLVADCEGYLEKFLEENPILYKKLNKIIFEEDYTDKCNYTKIKDNLKDNNFIEKEFSWIENAFSGDFHHTAREYSSYKNSQACNNHYSSQ